MWCVAPNDACSTLVTQVSTCYIASPNFNILNMINTSLLAKNHCENILTRPIIAKASNWYNLALTRNKDHPWPWFSWLNLPTDFEAWHSSRLVRFKDYKYFVMVYGDSEVDLCFLVGDVWMCMYCLVWTTAGPLMSPAYQRLATGLFPWYKLMVNVNELYYNILYSRDILQATINNFCSDYSTRWIIIAKHNLNVKS